METQKKSSVPADKAQNWNTDLSDVNKACALCHQTARRESLKGPLKGRVPWDQACTVAMRSKLRVR